LTAGPAGTLSAPPVPRSERGEFAAVGNTLTILLGRDPISVESLLRNEIADKARV
jgi:hypothetical protein